jgi:hypothetical protein
MICGEEDFSIAKVFFSIRVASRPVFSPAETARRYA